MKTNPHDPIHPTTTQDESFLNLKGETVQPPSTTTGGLTKIEHFALNAPDIPTWFNFRNSEEPKIEWDLIVKTFGKGSGHSESKTFQKYYDINEDTWDDSIPKELQGLKVEVQIVLNKKNAQIEAHQKWILQNDIDRHFAWRIFYAKRLIEELNKEEDEETPH